jgi:hypothetical protein
MILLLKLVLAHMLGDFLLQPDSWINAKEKDKLSSWQLYVHVLIHFVLIMALISDITFWKWALLLTIFHLGTDIAKLFLQTKKTKRTYFFADQFVHLFFICLVWILYQDKSFSLPVQTREYYFALITFIYAITKPAGVIFLKLNLN